MPATRWREGPARDMKGPLSPPWIIPRIAHSFSLFLGHSEVSTTERVYAHFIKMRNSNEKMQELANAL